MKKWTLSFLLLLGLNSLAQQSEQELDPVTITGTLQPRQMSRTGRNIISVRGDAFNAFPIQSVDELLRYLPGMEVQMRGPMGAQSDIVLRGGTFQQVLVLLDGIRVNDPNTGHFNSYIPISPAEIDRIEILKGASSAIYGAEAVGGVVHIITKTFAARPKEKNWQVSGQVKAGEYDFLNAQVGGFYQNGSTAIGGGWLANHTSGRQQRGTRGFVHNNTATLALSQQLSNEWQIAVRAGYDNRDFGAQNFYTTFLSDTATETVETVWSQARVAFNKGRHRAGLDIGFKKVKDDFRFNKSAIVNANKSELLQATLTDEVRINDRSTLVTGVQVLSKKIRSNDRGNHQVGQGGLFVLWQQSFSEYFTVHPALRLEYNERSGWELIPQLNLSYKKGNWQLRGSAGKTIRDADFTERFNNYNKAVVGAGSRVGNPDLLAERSFSYEAGADYFYGKSLRISGSFFQRLHRRLIDYSVTAYADMPRQDNLVPGANYALAKNVAEVNTTGAELDLQWNRSFGKDQSIYAAAGLLWLQSRSSDSEPSFYVSSHAKWLTNFFAEWRSAHVAFSVNGIYKVREAQSAPGISAELTRSYFVLNGRFAYLALQKRLQIFVELNNIFDRQYSDLLGSIMPGRWTMGGVAVKLGK
ncbi:MAG: TonB-dependent receptor plug domain-containing protein [Chitinophagaceae bacterium]